MLNWVAADFMKLKDIRRPVTVNVAYATLYWPEAMLLQTYKSLTLGHCFPFNRLVFTNKTSESQHQPSTQLLIFVVNGIISSLVPIKKVAIEGHQKYWNRYIPILISAFCRSLHQFGQCGSGKMRQNVLLPLKIAWIFKNGSKVDFIDIFKRISTLKYRLLHDSYQNAFASNLSLSSVPSSS